MAKIIAGEQPTGLKSLSRMMITDGQIEAAMPPGMLPPMPANVMAKPVIMANPL